MPLEPVKSLTAALYVRLSKEDRHKLNKEDDSESIINQRIMLLDYCTKHDIQIYDIYNDEDFSGSDRERPEFNRMITDAKNRKFNIIISKTQSRFARDMELTEKYINGLFPLWGIRYIGVVDNTDSTNFQNLKQRQISALVDEWYIQDLSANVKATLKAKRKQGLFVGAFAPYGYIKDPNNKNHLIIDDEAANVVKYVFQLYLEGLGVAAIARRLNDEGIPNPATYKKQHGHSFQNINGECADFWKTFTISNMLSNEVYIGNTVQGKAENISFKSNKKRVKPKSEWDIVQHTHKSIIDIETWDNVQRIRKEKPKSANLYKEPNIFACKVRCMDCGGSMRIYYANHRRYFRCTTHYVVSDKCGGKFISEKVLKESVLKEIHNLYERYIDENEIAQEIIITNEIDEKIRMIKSKIKSLQIELPKIEKRLKQIYVDKLDRVISQDDFLNYTIQFTQDKNDVKTKIQNLEAELANVQLNQQIKQDTNDIIHQFKDIKELDIVTVRNLINFIEVGGNKNNRIIKIHWNI